MPLMMCNKIKVTSFAFHLNLNWWHFYFHLTSGIFQFGNIKSILIDKKFSAVSFYFHSPASARIVHYKYVILESFLIKNSWAVFSLFLSGNSANRSLLKEYSSPYPLHFCFFLFFYLKKERLRRRKKKASDELLEQKQEEHSSAVKIYFKWGNFSNKSWCEGFLSHFFRV